MLSNNITSEEGFRNISFKGHFFTIEENVSSDILQYTTFSIDSKTNNIFLYKIEYSNISDNEYDDEYYDSIYTQKNFGKVSFENYDPETLKLLYPLPSYLSASFNRYYSSDFLKNMKKVFIHQLIMVR